MLNPVDAYQIVDREILPLAAEPMPLEAAAGCHLGEGVPAPGGNPMQAPLFEVGDYLDAGAVGLLDAMERRRVLAVRPPRVAAVGIYDEHTPHPLAATAGQPLLLALLKAAQADPMAMGRVRAQHEPVVATLATATARGDLIVCVAPIQPGGGLPPHLRAAFSQAGWRDIIEAVALDPGPSCMFGRFGKRLDDPLGFILPEEPTALYVSFQLFVQPMLRKMAGAPLYDHPRLNVMAGEPVEALPDVMRFLPARLHETGGRLAAYLTGIPDGPPASPLAGADVLLIVPGDQNDIAPGQEAEALVMDPARFTRVAAEHLLVLERRRGRPAGYMDGIDR